MSRSIRIPGLVLASLAVLWGCSGADGSRVPGDGGPEGGGGKGGATNSASGGSSAGGKTGTGGVTGTGGKGTGGTATGGSSAGGASNGGADASTGTTDAAAPDAEVPFDAGTPACPNSGNYVMVSNGAGCGDLNDDAPSQRLDSNGCSGRLEFDSGGTLGVSSGALTFDTTGVLGSSALNVGSSKMTCTGKTTAKTILLVCTGDAGTCDIALVHSTN